MNSYQFLGPFSDFSKKKIPARLGTDYSQSDISLRPKRAAFCSVTPTAAQ